MDVFIYICKCCGAKFEVDCIAYAPSRADRWVSIGGQCGLAQLHHNCTLTQKGIADLVGARMTSEGPS